MSLQSLLEAAKNSALEGKKDLLKTRLLQAEAEIEAELETSPFNPSGQEGKSQSHTAGEIRAEKYSQYIYQFLKDIVHDQSVQEAAAVRSYLMANSNGQYIQSSLWAPNGPVTGGVCAHIPYQP